MHVNASRIGRAAPHLPAIPRRLLALAVALVALYTTWSPALAHGGLDDGHEAAAPFLTWPPEVALAAIACLAGLALTARLLPRRRRALRVLLAIPALMLALLLARALAIQSQEPAALTAESFEPAMNAHEADEGVLLAPASDDVESVRAGRRCATGDAVRSYDVAAIDVEMTLNRYLDYDPEGRMYVLETDLERVRAEDAQNAAARAGDAEPAVSLGLQGDAIQPLILRVNRGECLRITLRNGTERAGGEPVSLHLHGSSLYVEGSATEPGEAAVAANPKTVVAPGESVTYAWWVGTDEPEGTHYFHSHGNTREQSNHGLFGAVIVEPDGARYLDPFTGEEIASGWAAMIEDPAGSDFREFALIYHEVGTERFRHRDRAGLQVQLVDRFTTAYKPGGRAINYRSEPFMNRLALQYATQGKVDISLAYSSYAFGDPATPIARSYLADPVKQRVLHGGSEVFHVHHVHGGGIRWRRQPDAEPSAFDTGLDKHPPLLPQVTERLDSQSIGPSESYDLANECGSGGCQLSAGDFLFHCHVAHHYVGGMWGIWRVYNTLQDGAASQDALPPLLELPDRRGGMAPAVPSDALAGTTVDWQGKTFDIDDEGLETWVERQLPPAGVPGDDDASLLDWRKEGEVYLNEPETEAVWPGYDSPAPGTRPALAFDPLTGKLAYPFLRPHLGKRPPFAPNHGPAPFLDPYASGLDPPQPGANGPWSLCPAGTQPKQFTIHAIELPLTLSERAHIVDPVGEIYVLKQEEEMVRAEHGRQTPLAIRANAGEECVDVLFKSELEDNGANYLHSKVSLHIHFVQFDIQAGDGVTTGFNYEQSIRPFTVEGETLAAGAAAGDETVALGSAARFQPGMLVGVGMDEDETFEARVIAAVEGDSIRLTEPLAHDHAVGEIVSAEFLRQRWYPDVQFGTAYFHDHVSALTAWKHGLFGALIAEPPGATYHDPATGAEAASGPVVDVHTESIVSPDIVGSFRELVLFLQDDSRLTRVGDSSGSAINMRVEPLAARGGDPAFAFSSRVHGDPETPLLQAYLGDPIVIRSLVPASNDVHTLHVDGHWFRAEPFSLTSPPVNTVHLGISERYDLMIPRAGGPQAMPGDYLYANGRTYKLREGSWGLIRVYGADETPALQMLPGHEVVPAAAASLCPADAPRRRFAVSATTAALPMLGGQEGRIYVLQRVRQAVESGRRAAEPLVLHVGVGDCIEVNLSNNLDEGAVSFHVDRLAADPQASLGVNAGFNLTQTVEPGDSRVYTYFAHPELGETVALVRDGGNPLVNPGLGLYGAIVVGPAGATYTDPITGEDLSEASSWRADVTPPAGPAYRDFTLFLQDEDAIIGNAVMPYTEHVAGVVGLNYRAEPLAARLEHDPDTASIYASTVHGDPATPLLEAYVGDPVRFHVLLPFNEQAHVFSLEGHEWPLEPGLRGSDLLSSVQVGALEAITIVPLGGAGGAAGLPGDYLYGDHREPFREAGLWGVFRVHALSAEDADLLPLTD